VVSPLSFDEYPHESTSSYLDVLDTSFVADFAAQTAQFSATLSEILSPQLAKPADFLSPATAAATASRCSLREWLLEEDAGWSDSVAGTSWSFSFPLSDCA
jgi:hypothetical protein